MDELRRIIGRELPLDQFHLTLRRTAKQVPGISAYGACLVTCSDERLGLLRYGFDRDVATPLIADVPAARDRVFSVSNLCGRLEPGSFALIDDHFTRPTTRGAKLLILEIVSHVGRIREGEQNVYGQIERFGRRSPCCGALTSLLNPPSLTGAVRHPWFEQLNAFFGPVRLASLRRLHESTRMVAAAIVHAALQAESAVADVMHAAATTGTEVLLVAGVSVNQQWADGFLPVAFHRIRAGEGRTEPVAGFSLRTTPEALEIDVSGARLEVAAGETMENLPRVPRGVADATVPEATLEALKSLTPHHKDELAQRLDAAREQVESVRRDPVAWRTYARPILRGLFRGLCVTEPELGVAALLYEGIEQIAATHRLKQLVEHGPSSVDGRRALHDIEAELQQLNHEDAQQVLSVLLAASNGPQQSRTER